MIAKVNLIIKEPELILKIRFYMKDNEKAIFKFYEDVLFYLRFLEQS